MIAVLTDSTSDLSPQAAQHFGIHVIPLHVHMAGRSLLDWEEVDPDAVYTHMSKGGSVTTSPTTADAFEQQYKTLLASHDAVVSIHISRKLSATAQHAREARARLPDPERVRVIDSMLAATPLAEVAIAARQSALHGDDLDQIERMIAQTRQELLAEFSVASLEYLRRSGRIGRATETLGNLLNLRPILRFDQGELKVKRRANRNQAAGQMLEQLRQQFGNDPVILAMAHAGRDSRRIAELHALVKASGLNVRRGRTLLLGPVIGAHVGPGTFGFLARPFVE